MSFSPFLQKRGDVLAFVVCLLTGFHLSSLQTSLFITIGPKYKENILSFVHRLLLYADLQPTVTKCRSLTTGIRTSAMFISLTSVRGVETSGCALMVQLRHEFNKIRLFGPKVIYADT